MRRLVPLLVLAAGCSDQAPPPSPPPAAVATARPSLSPKVMRAMLASGSPCIARYRGAMPASYVAQARVARSREGFLTLDLQAGERADFAACISGAIRDARIPVELGEPIELPLTFDFAST